MRFAAGICLGLGLLAFGLAFEPRAHAEYYCSPGYEPSYGGRCIAVAARDEVQLWLNESTDEYVVHRRKHRRHGVSSRY